MKSFKQKFDLIFGSLCVAGALTVIGMYIVSCSANKDIETVNETPNVIITELSSIEELDSALISFMFGTQSRGFDTPDIDLPGLDIDPDLGPLKGYQFSDTSKGVIAQTAQNQTDESIVYCSAKFTKSKLSLNISIKNDGNNYYTVYNEDGTKAFEVLYNNINNTYTCTKIFSANKFCKMIMGITGSLVSTAGSVPGRIIHYLIWDFVSNTTCDYFFAEKITA